MTTFSITDCQICRSQYVSGCPGCTEVKGHNDNNPEPLVLYADAEVLVAEIMQERDNYAYYPGCYEG